MNRVIGILLERLVGKGIKLSSIPAFIRDMANYITVNPSTDLPELNKMLHLMGWEDIEFDEYTLQLIIEIFESDFDSSGNLREKGIQLSTGLPPK